MTSQRLRRTLVPGIDSWSVMFAVGLSIAGVLIHNLAEFPVSILLAPETLVPVGITMLLGAAMLHRPRRGVFMVAIAWAVVVIVIGGGSVLPLSLVPFTPDQTASHYVAHVAYALAQIPFLWVAWRGVQAV